MGCDIHSFAEKITEGVYEKIPRLNPFNWRSYAIFGFLANVRNYSDVPPIAERRGIPLDVSNGVSLNYKDWFGSAHSPSWLSVKELIEFDYDIKIEDRRVTRQIGPRSWDGGCTAEPGKGKETTYREFLGEKFFTDLQKLKDIGADRIIFWFDN
jgi:hypothetical protein